MTTEGETKEWGMDTAPEGSQECDCLLIRVDETVSVADILRPLAERKVECKDLTHYLRDSCHGMGKVLDPRFDALRATYTSLANHHGSTYLEETHGIDASLGALARAMAACDLFIGEMGKVNGMWFCALTNSTCPDPQPWDGEGEGSTPEEAWARALVAAVRGR